MITLWMLQYGKLISEPHSTVKAAAKSALYASDSMYANPGRIALANGTVVWENSNNSKSLRELEALA